MKKLTLLLSCLVLLFVSCKKKEVKDNTFPNAETMLCALHSQEDDSSQIAYSDSLSQLLLNHPESMDYPFTLLCDEAHLHIINSPDGKVRIYSWDDGLGGTMRYFNNVIQLRTNTGVQTVYYPDVYGHDERDFANGYYTHLLTLKGKTDTYYLLGYKNMYSTMPECKTRNIYAFTLKNGRFALQKNFFESEIEEEVEEEYIEEVEVEEVNSIKLVDALREYGFPETEMVYKNDTLFFPRCHYNTDDFEKYVRYHFDGTMFRVVKG